MRIDPDRIHAPGTVADFLSKYGDASDIPNYDEIPPLVSVGSKHYHAAARQWKQNYGGEGYLSVWQPFAQYPKEISIGQVAVMAVDAKNEITETIEAGWMVNGALYGDFATRFFVYFTTTGYKESGPNKGGYDMTTGWVQTSATFRPGTILTETSALGGEQVEAYLRVELHDGKWWVRFQDEFVGYYPASLFSSTGLGTAAAAVQFHGETTDDLAIAGMTVTDMGSGEFPDPKAKRRSAYMRNLQLQPTVKAYERTPFLPEPTKVVATNPNCYGIIDDTKTTDAWHSQIYYGGPGQNPKCP